MPLASMLNDFQKREGILDRERMVCFSRLQGLFTDWPRHNRQVIVASGVSVRENT